MNMVHLWRNESERTPEIAFDLFFELVKSVDVREKNSSSFQFLSPSVVVEPVHTF